MYFLRQKWLCNLASFGQTYRNNAFASAATVTDPCTAATPLPPDEQCDGLSGRRPHVAPGATTGLTGAERGWTVIGWLPPRASGTGEVMPGRYAEQQEGTYLESVDCTSNKNTNNVNRIFKNAL